MRRQLFVIQVIKAVLLVSFLSSAVTATDPDTFRNASDLIISRGYPFNTFSAPTSDGYILSLFRIPRPGRPVVLLQHGLMDTGATFVLNDNTHSIAYLLFDSGYDVFMCNSRGSKYSLDGTLSYESSSYWHFDWDHHANYDVPACIQKTLAVTGRSSLSYIGHSQGATIGFAALSRIPYVSQRVNLFVALAPVTYMSHQGSKLLGLLGTLHADKIVKLLGDGEFVPTPDFLSKILGIQCIITPSLCNNLLSSLFGDSGRLDKSRMGVFTAHWPDMTSRMNMIHWIQNARSGDFAALDGTSYDIRNIRVPTAVYYGTYDYLGDTMDVAEVLNALTDAGQLVDSQSYEFAHMDFVWAYDAASLVYPRILSLLSTYSK